MPLEPDDFLTETLLSGCRMYLKRPYFLRDEVTAGARTAPTITDLETRIASTLLFMKDISR